MKRVHTVLVVTLLGFLLSVATEAMGQTTVVEKEPRDPREWLDRSEAPIGSGTISCKEQGGSATIEQSVTRSVEWSMEVGVTAGIDWGVVSAELTATAGVTVGSSTTTTLSRTVGGVAGHNVRFFGYAAYQKRVYNVTQDGNTRRVVVWIPTGSVAIDWTECTPKENCGNVTAGTCPTSDPSICGGPSADPQLPGPNPADVACPAVGACCDVPNNECTQYSEAECKALGKGFTYRGDGTPCGTDGTCIPTVSEWGLVVMAILVLSAATVVIMRRRAIVHG